QRPFRDGLARQAEPVLSEVAETAVNELGGAATRPAGKIVFLDQSDLQAPRRRVEGDSGSGDSTADDDQVELLGPRARDLVLAPAQRYGSAFQQRRRVDHDVLPP